MGIAQEKPASPAKVEENRRFEQTYELQVGDTLSAASRRWALNEGVEFEWDHPMDIKIMEWEQAERLNRLVALSIAERGGLGKNLVVAIDTLIQSLNQQTLGAMDKARGIPMAQACVFGTVPTQPTLIRVMWAGERCGAKSD